MSSTSDMTDSLNNLSLKNDTDVPKKTTKAKATYDKVALKERWKILGTDPEQSTLMGGEGADCKTTIERLTHKQTHYHRHLIHDSQGLYEHVCSQRLLQDSANDQTQLCSA